MHKVQLEGKERAQVLAAMLACSDTIKGVAMELLEKSGGGELLIPSVKACLVMMNDKRLTEDDNANDARTSLQALLTNLQNNQVKND